MRVVERTNIELPARPRDRVLDLVIAPLADEALMSDLSFESLYEEPRMLVAANSHRPAISSRSTSTSARRSVPSA